MLPVEKIASTQSTANVASYDALYDGFSWQKDVPAQLFAWDEQGRMNMGYEVCDKHVVRGRGEHVALIDVDGSTVRQYTFQQLQDRSNQFGNLFRQLGVQMGDRVFFYMPRMMEVYAGLIGALKVGAIVGPLFEAFMEDAVYDRLHDAEACVIVTTTELRARIRDAQLPYLRHIVLIDADRPLIGIEIDGQPALDAQSTMCPIVWATAETPMILHYTSGSTGKPKGVMHVHGAMVQQAMTALWVLDLRPTDVYWCTADPGWVTGTSYGLFAPWLHGVTNVVVRGRFDPKKWYHTIATHQVTVWYSAPTAFRMLMASGDALTRLYDLRSLRHVLSVGEPLNPEVIRWGIDVLHQRIHDTWWMTETGAQMICNLPCMEVRLGSMGKPLPGIVAAIVDDEGRELPPLTIGNLAIRAGWPSMMRSIWNNPEKYASYFALAGWYVSGDAAYRDEEGYFWFQGRVDDVINTSGERVGPFEVESKLVEHPAIAEAGVIGKPDALRGEMIKAFVSLREGFSPSEQLIDELKKYVRQGLSAHAMPREIEIVPMIPKTRSGKIMRRVLKARELGLPLGDLSTMEAD